MTESPATHVILQASPNAGYGPDQIQCGVTLGQLLEMVEEAVERYGSDARVVTNNGQRYGASYGYIGREDIVAAGECEFCGEVDCDCGDDEAAYR